VVSFFWDRGSTSVLSGKCNRSNILPLKLVGVKYLIPDTIPETIIRGP
jgi:hypothetical protein